MASRTSGVSQRILREYNGIPRMNLFLFLKECEFQFSYGRPVSSSTRCGTALGYNAHLVQPRNSSQEGAEGGGGFAEAWRKWTFKKLIFLARG